MKTQEIIKALRTTTSRSKRALLDEGWNSCKPKTMRSFGRRWAAERNRD